MDSILCSGSASSPAATSGAVNHNFPQCGGAVWSGTNVNRNNVLPIAGVLSKLYVQITVDPGAGASWVFVIQKNGVDSALTVTITTGGALVMSDLTNTVSFNAGDTINLKSTASATAPAATGTITWTMQITGTVDGESLIMGSTSGTLAAGTTAWMAMQNDNVFDTTAAINRSSVMPTAGVISNAYMNTEVALGAASTYTSTLIVNGTPTALSVSVTAGQNGSDLTHSVNVAAGDIVYWEVVSSVVIVTARRVHMGARFVPTVNGESVSMAYGGATQAQNLTRYQAPGGGINTWNSTEAPRQSITLACTVKSLYVYEATAPASGQTDIVTLRKNAADFASSITCTVTGTAASGNDTTHSNTVVDGDLLSIKAVTSATTGTLQRYVSFVMYVAPTSVFMPSEDYLLPPLPRDYDWNVLVCQ